MPKKPTQPFGHIRFSSDGRVRREMFRLPDEKADQERAVVTRFVELHNLTWPPPPVTEIAQLREADNDFSASVGETSIVIELTEVVERSFTRCVSEDEFRRIVDGWPKGREMRFRRPGGELRLTDIEARDAALSKAISSKVERWYSRPDSGEFWLVVFSVAPLDVESIRDGALHESRLLARARSYLRGSGTGPFSAVWFTDLQTRPVRIWPEPAEAIPVVRPDGLG